MADIVFVVLLLVFLIALDRKTEGKSRLYYICLAVLTLYLGFVVINAIVD